MRPPQVGSIAWTGGGTPGTTVKRGDELGYFAYGGSTVVALFPPGIIQCVLGHHFYILATL